MPRNPVSVSGAERPGGLATHTGDTTPPATARRSRPARPSPKRGWRALLALCAGATILIGCPLYSEECDSRNDCASGFYCDQFSRQCTPILDAIGCTRPSQCEVGETCTPDFVCRPGSCDYHGCVRGYRCGVVDFAHTCVSNVDDEEPLDASLPPSGADGGGSGDVADGGALDAGGTAADAAP